MFKKSTLKGILLATLTAALAACGQTPVASTSGSTLSAQSTSDMNTAEAAGSFGAWMSGSFGAWMSGSFGVWVSTTPDGMNNTFSENLAEWDMINLPEAQAINKNLGAGVLVAVIDTGIDLSHPGFYGKLAPSGTWYDFVTGDVTPQEGGTSSDAGYGHGTAVSHLVLQIAPNAKIMPLRVMNPDGSGSSALIAQAVDWAVSKGAKVINLSAVSETDSVLSTALENAASKGVYVVMAAGNNFKANVLFPARRATTTTSLGNLGLSAGSIDTTLKKSDFSAYGANMELLAPGRALYTAFPGGGSVAATGTSFAAPVLSGALALGLGDVYSSRMVGKLAAQAAATYLNVDAYNKEYLITGNKLGYGLLNVQAFIQSIK